MQRCKKQSWTEGYVCSCCHAPEIRSAVTASTLSASPEGKKRTGRLMVVCLWEKENRESDGCVCPPFYAGWTDHMSPSLVAPPPKALRTSLVALQNGMSCRSHPPTSSKSFRRHSRRALSLAAPLMWVSRFIAELLLCSQAGGWTRAAPAGAAHRMPVVLCSTLCLENLTHKCDPGMGSSWGLGWHLGFISSCKKLIYRLVVINHTGNLYGVLMDISVPKKTLVWQQDGKSWEDLDRKLHLMATAVKCSEVTMSILAAAFLLHKLYLKCSQKIWALFLQQRGSNCCQTSKRFYGKTHCQKLDPHGKEKKSFGPAFKDSALLSALLKWV